MVYVKKGSRDSSAYTQITMAQTIAAHQAFVTRAINNGIPVSQLGVSNRDASIQGSINQ